ncbi:hypothetical protein HERIO_142 [Hepatospora eriocheir]|uniref:Uncharacterized protein n=1 Tax=Hepatospora eriocheir TaxID=1081669 RepID=A0A1X0QE43_9MICR|nr:hypothetical protein HERIO_142 [Hepatospora eriocheir]
MKFSALNKNYIKLNLESDKKNECIKDLSKQIETLEADMYSKLNTAYLGVINKCVSLENLDRKVQSIQIINSDYHSLVKDSVLRSNEVCDDLSTVEKGIERIETIEEEFSLILKFLEMSYKIIDTVNSYDRENIYESRKILFQHTQNVKEIESLFNYFKKYNFTTSINNIYGEANRQFICFIRMHIENWLNMIRYQEIGALALSIDFKPKVFDDIDVLRREIISKEFLCIVYVSDELKLSRMIVEFIENYRNEQGFKNYKKFVTPRNISLNKESTENEETIEEENEFSLMFEELFNKSNDEIRKKYLRKNLPIDITDKELEEPEFQTTLEQFYYLIANILLSHFIIEYFPNCRTFFDEIISEIDNFKFYEPKYVKVIILPLKRILSGLNIDSDKLDVILQKIVFNYFNTYLKGDSPDDIIKFIDNSTNFLKDLKQFSNELDELLRNKIDKTLIKYFKRNKGDNTEEVHMNNKKAIMESLNYLKKQSDYFRIQQYQIENEIFENEKKFVDKKVKEIIKSKSNINNVIKLIVNLKEYMDENIRLRILSKVIEELKNTYKGDNLVLFSDTLDRNFNLKIK